MSNIDKSSLLISVDPEATSLSELFCLRLSEWVRVINFLQGKIKIAIDDAIFRLIYDNYKLKKFYAKFMKKLFSTRKLNSHEKIFILTSAMDYMFRRLLGIYLFETENMRIGFPKPRVYRKTRFHFKMNFDTSKNTIARILCLSREEMITITRILMPTISNMLDNILDKNREYKGFTKNLVRKIIQTTIPNKLIMPSIIIGLYVVVEKILSIVKEEFWAINYSPGAIQSALPENYQILLKKRTALYW